MKVVFLARDPVERAWSQLSMGVRLGMINKFDATDPEEVHCNLLNPGVLVRSHPRQESSRWKRYVRPENFRIYFFDDLKIPLNCGNLFCVFWAAIPISQAAD